MKVAVTGARGFLGSHVAKNLQDRGHEVVMVPITGRITEPSPEHLDNLLNAAWTCDRIINCVVSKRPKNEIDNFINAEAPLAIQQSLERRKLSARLIHVSSLNTLITELKDPYTISKRQAEKALNGHCLTIIRCGLIWSFNGEGNAEMLERYYKIPLPVHPMIYPGNFYRPVMVDDVARIICEVAEEGSPNSALNIIGSTRTSMWDLAKDLASQKGRRLIPLPARALLAIAPKSAALRMAHHELLQQFLDVDRSLFKNSSSNIVVPFPPIVDNCGTRLPTGNQ